MTFGLDLDSEYNKVYRVFIVDLMNIPSSTHGRVCGRRGGSCEAVCSDHTEHHLQFRLHPIEGDESLSNFRMR